jgi:hypothetical protein
MAALATETETVPEGLATLNTPELPVVRDSMAGVTVMGSSAAVTVTLPVRVVLPSLMLTVVEPAFRPLTVTLPEA